ncbi:MAG TPA: hypothetical protein VIK14_16475, partial [Ignavibacteria bacterium]
MKKIVFKSTVLFAVIFVFLISYFSKSPAEKNGNSPLATTAIHDTQFIIGAFDDGVESNYIHNHDELGFNTWHCYTETEFGWRGIDSDKYYCDTNHYKPGVNNRIDSNGSNHMRTFMDRPIIQYVISGQRIDYQCENVQNGAPFGFWAYNNSLNNSNTVYDM